MRLSRNSLENERKNKDFDDLNPHPGFATTIFVSWDEIADYLGLFDTWELTTENEGLSEDFVEVAFSEAQKWAALIKERGHTPTDQELVDKENQLLSSLKDHWSARTVLLAHFDIEKMIEDTNNWSHNGAKQAFLFGNPLCPGKSLESFSTSLGISFTVYEPFMIPYTEIYYSIYDELPEWNYDEIIGMDIIETLFGVYETSAGEISIDLTNWSSKWKFIDPDVHPTTHRAPGMEDLIVA